MGSFIIGILMVTGGFFLVWKTNWFISNFGGVAWAEQHLGSEGGSRLFIKFIGIIIILLGFTIITGVFQPMLLSWATPLFSSLK
ncbi:MAG: hypothetical protein HY973_04640 [Candidatus Kerfeldbacteria bacterium]|nr:hypothetical protein [Candidatus Kerfeldbacteria bacterium]